MPNTHSTLTGLFTDIADAIREKDGTSTPKVADAFPAAIRAIPTGGGEDHDAEDGMVARTISVYENSRVTTIGTNAFNGCEKLTTVSFPACTTIGNGAFRGCEKLATMSFPACTTISSNAFHGCSRLATVSFPACTVIVSYAFSGCTSLTTVSFLACTTIGNNVFHGCSRLATVSFPACTTIGSYAFNSCSSLTTVSFPACKEITNYAFSGCSSLTTVSFPACTTIGSYAFNKCYNLLSLYLATSSVCVLLFSNAFSSTPIAGYTTSTSGAYGSIFVPASLVAAYKSATNWTYFADRIAAIPEEV